MGKDDLGHWQYAGEIPNDFCGFLYTITSPNGKRYVGRKNRYIKRSKIKESNWRNYTGSCKTLNNDIKRLGKKYFGFQIIKFCRTKQELALAETKEIIDRDAIFSPDYYNAYLFCKIINNKK